MSGKGTPSPLRRTLGSARSDELVLRAFARLDKIALGVAVGSLFGLVVSGATIFLLIKGGDPVGPNLGLLGQYFIGYTVSISGSIVGLGYGLLLGFVVGWSIGFLRNSLLSIYIHTVRFKMNLDSIIDILDHTEN